MGQQPPNIDIEGKKWTVNYEGVEYVALDTSEEGILNEIYWRKTLWAFWRRMIFVKKVGINWLI